MRVLVTGSRDWPESHKSIIKQAIMGVAQEGFDRGEIGDQTVVVSGHCPTGADQMAEQIAWDQYLGVETHPADWEHLGRRAGFVRNAEMVALGAEYCLAFIKDASKGATMTADLAEKAGIKTYRFKIETHDEQT